MALTLLSIILTDKMQSSYSINEQISALIVEKFYMDAPAQCAGKYRMCRCPCESLMTSASTS